MVGIVQTAMTMDYFKLAAGIPSPEAYQAAVQAVRASVAAGAITRAQGDQAIARLNAERIAATVSSEMPLRHPVVPAAELPSRNEGDGID